MTAKSVFLGAVVLLALVNFAVMSKTGVEPHPAVLEHSHCDRDADYFDVPGWHPATWFDVPDCGRYYEESSVLTLFTWVPMALGAIAAWMGYCELVSWRMVRNNSGLRRGERVDHGS